MVKKMLLALRVIAMFAALLLAVIATLYVLDLFSGEYLRELAIKTMQIVGILTGLSLITIFLAGGQEKQ
ncbi:MAG: hypothetical protein H8E62_07205 [Planctomycetes bacterium]|nr:hypothetical protein [Planctomycetota bacterium]